jgi:site-specific DNA-methyltransferase (adenine-specific)
MNQGILFKTEVLTKMDGTPAAQNNRTLFLSSLEKEKFQEKILSEDDLPNVKSILNKTVNADSLIAAKYIVDESVDLLILDPPYNITKKYGTTKFKEKNTIEYKEMFSVWVDAFKKKLSKTATVYVCSDWRTSSIICPVLEENFFVRNRITWERNKGRGSKSNWKNCSEDIWHLTMSNDYTFNYDKVMLKRKVIAPYRENGLPKDWINEGSEKFRLTYPSNFWSDITIPFWSMPENTDHPTQKPEKLIAKLILASTNKNDLVLDPFLGSGTTSVVSKKLDRNFIGIERENKYCLYAEKRLLMSQVDKSIQGYDDEVFWERNSVREKEDINVERSQRTIKFY